MNLKKDDVAINSSDQSGQNTQGNKGGKNLFVKDTKLGKRLIDAFEKDEGIC